MICIVEAVQVHGVILCYLNILQILDFYIILLYRDVATAILSHHRWKDTMRLTVSREDKKRGKTHIITPMRMLIQTMPGNTTL